MQEHKKCPYPEGWHVRVCKFVTAEEEDRFNVTEIKTLSKLLTSLNTA